MRQRELDELREHHRALFVEYAKAEGCMSHDVLREHMPPMLALTDKLMQDYTPPEEEKQP